MSSFSEAAPGLLDELEQTVTGDVNAFPFANLYAKLAPGGKLWLTAPAASVPAMTLPLLMAGFSPDTSVSPEPVEGGCVRFSASKPTWQQGDAAKIRVPQKAAIKLGTDDMDELVDEDDLLAADGLEVPAAAAGGGCKTSRKACANCSCGRAELEASGNYTPLDAPPVASACGNCHKGDAFRCAGCPMLGKPAFESGHAGGKLVLAGLDEPDL